MSDGFGCVCCKIMVRGTLAGITVAVTGFVVGLATATDGAAVALIPEEAALTEDIAVGAVEVETGLPAARIAVIIRTVLLGFVAWAAANPLKAAAAIAFTGETVAYLMGEFADSICKESGSCDG